MKKQQTLEKISNLTEEQTLELFKVEELEMRLEMMQPNGSGSCPGGCPDSGTTVVVTVIVNVDAGCW